jgi:hypothetical protein
VPTVTWPALFGVFLLCHLTGDFLTQTEFQATHKHNGLARDPIARRALLSHGLLYTAMFVPALVWIAYEADTLTAIAAAALIMIPHGIVDDGRLVRAWVRDVKRVPGAPPTVVYLGVDQTMHVLVLALVALVATG